MPSSTSFYRYSLVEDHNRVITPFEYYAGNDGNRNPHRSRTLSPYYVIVRSDHLSERLSAVLQRADGRENDATPVGGNRLGMDYVPAVFSTDASGRIRICVRSGTICKYPYTDGGALLPHGGCPAFPSDAVQYETRCLGIKSPDTLVAWPTDPNGGHTIWRRIDNRAVVAELAVENESNIRQRSLFSVCDQ